MTSPRSHIAALARRACLAASLAALAVSLPARASAEGSSPVGFRVSADLGGGGQFGAGSIYDGASLFELEGTFSSSLVIGLGPELSMVLGMTPGTYFAIRPGIRWEFPGSPFYMRAFFDASTQIGYMSWRWFVLGGGFQLRFTDVLGFFAEVDGGFPIASGAGWPLMVRAGASIGF